jgi:hypothetical protein
VLSQLPYIKLDPWRNRTPTVLKESRSLAGVLRDTVSDYRVRIAATNGQCGGFLRTGIAPRLSPGERMMRRAALGASRANVGAGHRLQSADHRQTCALSPPGPFMGTRLEEGDRDPESAWADLIRLLRDDPDHQPRLDVSEDERLCPANSSACNLALRGPPRLVRHAAPTPPAQAQRCQGSRPGRKPRQRFLVRDPCARRGALCP